MLFFALSGFLMAYHYFPNVHSVRYWASFIAHRLIRVYPVFFIATLVYLVSYFYYHDQTIFGISLPWAETSSCWTMVSCPDFFWTIPIEIKFYLLYPFVAFLLSILFHRWPVYSVLMCALPFAMASKFFYPILGNGNVMPLFLCGTLAGFVCREKPALQSHNRCGDFFRTFHKHGNIFSILLLGVFAVMIAWTGTHRTSNSEYWMRTGYLAPILALIVYCVAMVEGSVSRLFSLAIARWVGKISFSLYLMHKLAINLVNYYLPVYFKNPLIAFFMAFLFSVIFYWIVERFFVFLGKRVSFWIISK